MSIATPGPVGPADGLDAASLVKALEARDCGACWTCVPDYPYMRLCSECGNKRCPHANDHRNACTSSNDTGQPGSAYEHGSGAASARRFAATLGPDHPVTRAMERLAYETES